VDLPALVQLTHCESGASEFARIQTLTREVAKTQIDAVWWDELATPLRDPNGEPDRHWQWRVIVAKHQNRPYFRAKSIQSQDGTVQAAMLLRVDALSALEEGQGAVFVDRLAAAPRNRDKLASHPMFRGCGSGLLAYAVALSYSLGFSGRVNLFPVAHEDFYVNRGFQATDVVEDENTLFEIPASKACQFLRARGLIDA
jgi:hypothetical protein